MYGLKSVQNFIGVSKELTPRRPPHFRQYDEFTIQSGVFETSQDLTTRILPSNKNDWKKMESKFT